jgi:hypothetical protein
MKSHNFTLHNHNELPKSIEELIDISTFRQEAHLLIQVFCGQGKHILEEVITALTTLLPHASCIGTTTDGEIEGSDIHTRKTVISLSTFTDTHISSANICTGNSFQNGVYLAQQLITDNTKLLLVLQMEVQVMEKIL